MPLGVMPPSQRGACAACEPALPAASRAAARPGACAACPVSGRRLRTVAPADHGQGVDALGRAASPSNAAIGALPVPDRRRPVGPARWALLPVKGGEGPPRCEVVNKGA